jgi:hypothetical protein
MWLRLELNGRHFWGLELDPPEDICPLDVNGLGPCHAPQCPSGVCRDAAVAHFECLRIAAQEKAEELAPVPLACICPSPKECEAVACWGFFQEGLLQKRMLTKVLKQQVPAPVPATSTGEGIASATAATAPPASATSVTSATAPTAPTAGTATATGTAQTSQKTSTSTSTSTYLSIAAIRQKWSIPGCDVSSLTLDTRGCNSMLQKLASYLGFHLGPFWDPDGAPFGTCQTGTH